MFVYSTELKKFYKLGPGFITRPTGLLSTKNKIETTPWIVMFLSRGYNLGHILLGGMHRGYNNDLGVDKYQKLENSCY